MKVSVMHMATGEVVVGRISFGSDVCVAELPMRLTKNVDQKTKTVMYSLIPYSPHMADEVYFNPDSIVAYADAKGDLDEKYRQVTSGIITPTPGQVLSLKNGGSDVSSR